MLLYPNSSLVVTDLYFQSQNTSKVASRTRWVTCGRHWQSPIVSLSTQPWHGFRQPVAVSHVWLLKWHPLADHILVDQVPRWKSHADNAKAQWVQMLAIVKGWFCGSYLFHGRSPSFGFNSSCWEHCLCQCTGNEKQKKEIIKWCISAWKCHPHLSKWGWAFFILVDGDWLIFIA